MAQQTKRNILQRLDAGEVLLSDGGFIFQLERRGYVHSGYWTPEVSVEHPDAVAELHKEFRRAGSDIMQSLTFFASDNKATGITGAQINSASCQLAKVEAAKGENILVTASVTKTDLLATGGTEQQIKDVLRKQIHVFVEEGVNFIICEYFENATEMVYAIEVAKETPLPVLATMCIGPEGDFDGLSPGDCAVRMAKAGADVVGVNCKFDPFISLKTVQMMKEGLAKANLKAHLMCQPLGFFTPDVSIDGYMQLPEFPYALEARQITRFEAAQYARQAYNMGVRVIGGCCGFEAYHIRSMAQELSSERGRTPISAEKHLKGAACLAVHCKPYVSKRASEAYWTQLNPSSGRPLSAAFSKIQTE